MNLFSVDKILHLEQGIEKNICELTFICLIKEAHFKLSDQIIFD